MKKLTAALILVTLILNGYAQKRVTDSLKKLLNEAMPDTTRVVLLRNLGNGYSTSKPDSAMVYYQEGLELSRRINFMKGQKLCLNNLGNMFVEKGNYPKALNFYFESLKIAETLNDRLQMAKVWSNIGTLYFSENDFRQSIKFTLKALAIAESIHNEKSIAIELGNLGFSYERLKILDSALIYAKRSLDVSVKLKENYTIGTAKSALGDIYYDMHKPHTAMDYYRAAIPFNKLAGDDVNLNETMLSMAKTFKQLGQPDSSLYYARQSLSIAVRGGFPLDILDISKFLSTYFREQGKLDSAFHYQELSIALKDRMFNQENTKVEQNITFAERQRQQDIAAQEVAHQANIRFYLMMAVIIFLVVLAFIFWLINRNNQKASRLLKRQKEQIQATLGQLEMTQNQLIQSAKMASLGELTASIANEIQSPLELVNNFSDVSIGLVDEMQSQLKNGNKDDAIAISQVIKQNLDKVRHQGKRADGIVKGMLQHSRISTVYK
ncbi:MAG TPA: tetratricopeptide repeat protein [Mucilaginibacter sp.]|jgi:tetratricopeptide (TPR) repeat protein